MQARIFAVAALLLSGVATPAFAADGFLACELRSSTYNGKFALVNVSRGEASTAAAALPAYKTWANWHQGVANQIHAVRNSDPTIVTAQTSGECTAFAALADAQAHVVARMKTLAAGGFFNISTDWQPKSTSNPVTIVYVACELTAAIDDKRKVAVHNLSRNDASSTGQVVPVYFASRTYDREIRNGLTDLGVDPRPITERLSGSCTAYDTEQQAKQMYDQAIQKRSAEGFVNIMTEWQPPLPPAS